jgi:ParB-like chromosome segregation protein Spo0J
VVALSTLIPYASNSRTHTEAQIAQVAASIKEFGFTSPILTDGDAGIVAGHCRLAAARLLGLTVVPTIDLAHLTPAQRKAYVIADNKLALDAGWDNGMLLLEFEQLNEMGFDTSLTGFSLDDIEALAIGDGSDHESLNAGGDNSKSGVGVDTLSFGKSKVELGDGELERLQDALKQYLDAYGSSAGFATWLIEGNADA